MFSLLEICNHGIKNVPVEHMIFKWRNSRGHNVIAVVWKRLYYVELSVHWLIRGLIYIRNNEICLVFLTSVAYNMHQQNPCLNLKTGTNCCSFATRNNFILLHCLQWHVQSPGICPAVSIFAFPKVRTSYTKNYSRIYEDNVLRRQVDLWIFDETENQFACAFWKFESYFPVRFHT